MNSIAVYCGSSDRIPEIYLHGAGQIGALLAQRGIRVVYGAGSTGMMGAVARAALEQGGEVTGIMPKIFDAPHLALLDIQDYRVVETLHIRKATIAELSDGFIALPGGLGTFEEFFEIVTWAQIGLHSKPIGLFNINGYYDPLMAFLEKVEQDGFMYKRHRALFQLSDDPEELLAAMENYNPPIGLEKWVDRES